MAPLYIESAILLNLKIWQHLRDRLSESNIVVSTHRSYMKLAKPALRKLEG